MDHERRTVPRLTLTAASVLVGLFLLAGGVTVAYRLLDAWRMSLLEAADQLREAASRRVAVAVAASLAEAELAALSLERQLAAGVVRPGDPSSLEAGLLRPLLDEPHLAEVALTRGRTASRPPDQLSVFRLPTGGIDTRATHEEHGRFVSDRRHRGPGETRLDGAPFVREAGTFEDPTRHATFETTASPENAGRLLWSDLHYTALDAHLPESERRVVVTALKAVAVDGGVGVVRVALWPEALDRVRSFRVDESAERDPHVVFLCDDRGRLVSRLSAADAIAETDGDLRVVPASVPPEVAAALADPALRAVDEGRPSATVRLAVSGRAYLARFEALAGTQDWRVVIVGPEDHYLGELRRARRALLLQSAAIALLLLLGGAVLLAALRRGLGRIVDGTRRMSAFEFAPAPAGSAFRDVGDVLGGLELAKTAMRAMSRYVPVDLVRGLYASRREPVLGGTLREVSMMFTDIEGFTTLSERLGPDALAALLGRYLEVMTDTIHRSAGIVDKYVGDAVMALWNAPADCADHAARACEAALACREAERALVTSAAWTGPALRTRFGLHCDRVMVGHFGAPDRMSYTALGDGVNLSSRLEGLNKAYGTWILASGALRDAAGDAFAFRLVDRVAVKGKTRGVAVYELLGRAAEVPPVAIQNARAYEAAFSAYGERRFADALSALTACDDAPAAALAERCRAFVASPPPADWDGVWHAREK
jgi:adenylate cyclase